nr:MAG TPA: holin [Caudoviricetes sp.]
MNEALKVIQTLVFVFFAGGFGYGGAKFLKKQASVQKNEHIKTILTFASQAVLSAQAFLGNGSVQQQAAAAELKARLEENKLGDNFTEAQILSYIKTAYAREKANGALGAVKPLVSAEELAKAEEVVSNTPETAQAPTA